MKGGRLVFFCEKPAILDPGDISENRPVLQTSLDARLIPHSMPGMSSKLCSCCFLVALLTLVKVFDGTFVDPDYGRETCELILSRGFRCQEHSIFTRDGYILTAFRILDPEVPASKSPVILVHGLFESSRDFVIAGPDGHRDEGTSVVGNCMGFELAKRGFDVWLLNCRGNSYSQNHTIYRDKRLGLNTHPAFWDYSYEDIGMFDVPATVAHVLKVTGRPTVAYIGHSRGSGAMFAALSVFPYLNKQIQPFIALSPVVRVKYASGLLWNVGALTGSSNFPVGQKVFFPKKSKKTLCSLLNGLFCAKILHLVGGDSMHLFNGSRMPVIFESLPSGSSAKDLRLFVQNEFSGRFAYYDYGNDGNKKRYGRRDAPDFPLESITNREIYLMKGASDVLAPDQDTEWLTQKLGDRIRSNIVIPIRGWGHMAMIFGQDAGLHVITPILQILNSYE